MFFCAGKSIFDVIWYVCSGQWARSMRPFSTELAPSLIRSMRLKSRFGPSIVNRDRMFAWNGSYFWIAMIESVNDALPR
jgi:hypothetical protein